MVFVISIIENCNYSTWQHVILLVFLLALVMLLISITTANPTAAYMYQCSYTFQTYCNYIQDMLIKETEDKSDVQSKLRLELAKKENIVKEQRKEIEVHVQFVVSDLIMYLC